MNKELNISELRLLVAENRSKKAVRRVIEFCEGSNNMKSISEIAYIISSELHDVEHMKLLNVSDSKSMVLINHRILELINVLEELIEDGNNYAKNYLENIYEYFLKRRRVKKIKRGVIAVGSGIIITSSIIYGLHIILMLFGILLFLLVVYIILLIVSEFSDIFDG